MEKSIARPYKAHHAVCARGVAGLDGVEIDFTL